MADQTQLEPVKLIGFEGKLRNTLSSVCFVTGSLG